MSYKIYYWLLFACILQSLSCTSSPDKQKRPGICISFDDQYVKEWYSLTPLLKKNKAKVTFFVTKFDSLDYKEIELLRKLENEGHEIGSHGNMHVISGKYIKQYSWQDYIDNEIIANKIAMKAKGFEPVSFAYPYGAKYYLTDYFISNHHGAIRSDVAVNNERDLTLIDDIYYDFDGDFTFYSIGFDKVYHLTQKMVEQAMARAAKNNEILFLHG
ncbi:hypothetical protein E1176_00690, partial [Fulvivirga sp. RKSG066]|uniref:polysaccharide deacetylase family protein n=1 Tax=Fulvivirga aurantia TaxID=2529383 RepID=UPI0012BBB147